MTSYLRGRLIDMDGKEDSCADSMINYPQASSVEYHSFYSSYGSTPTGSLSVSGIGPIRRRTNNRKVVSSMPAKC